MPLIKGKKAATKEGIQENIRREMHANPGMNPKQAVAIAYAQARKATGVKKAPSKKKKKA